MSASVTGDRDRLAGDALAAGRRTRIRQLRHGDFGWLWPAAMAPSVIGSWRLSGRTMSLDEFIGQVWASSDVHLVVESLRDREPLALVELFNLDLHNEHGELAVLVPEHAQRSAWPFEGVLLAVDYAFTRFAIRKLYVRTTAAGARRYVSGSSRFLTLEATLRQRQFADGAFQDQLVYSVSRDTFDFDLVHRVLGTVDRAAPRSWDGQRGRVFAAGRRI